MEALAEVIMEPVEAQGVPVAEPLVTLREVVAVLLVTPEMVERVASQALYIVAELFLKDVTQHQVVEVPEAAEVVILDVYLASTQHSMEVLVAGVLGFLVKELLVAEDLAHPVAAQDQVELLAKRKTVRVVIILAELEVVTVVAAVVREHIALVTQLVEPEDLVRFA